MPRAVFKQYSQGQICLFPRSLDEKIPENAPVRLVNQIVDDLEINLQIGTENQFITHFDFFSNRNDFFTLIPFSNGFKKRYQKMPTKVVADSGYGSEENYESLQSEDIEAFVKYPMFHAEQKKAFKNNPFIAQNLFYNKEKSVHYLII